MTGAGGERVPQRLCLVLPTTAEFDSRTYRIASAFAGRGHAVTVLARLAPGLPAEESGPGGYRIVRVPVSAADGLPLPRGVRGAIEHARRRGRAHARAAAASGGAGSSLPTGATPSPATRGRSLLARGRRTGAAVVRVAAIALTVRSQERNARQIVSAADLYHGMAYMGIPVALGLARTQGGRVVYDARDIYVDANNLARLPGPARRLLGWVERRWARRADRVVTVNRPYAEVMAARFGVPLPAIVMNCSYRFEVADPPVARFHERLGLQADVRVVLYQGGFSRERGIEQLIDAIRLVPGAVLVLLGYGPLESEIANRAAAPEVQGRVHVLPAVPPTELVSWVAAADVVAMPIQPSTLNHRLTTPNKLFEAMAAGVPVVASDLPGMAAIVRETRCGLLVDPTDPVAIAAAIREILDAPPDERRAWRQRSLAAAHETYNWERQVEILADEYGLVTGRPW